MKSEGGPTAASNNAAADPRNAVPCGQASHSETPPTPSAGAGRRRAGCRVGFSPPFPPIPPIRPKPPSPSFPRKRESSPLMRQESVGKNRNRTNLDSRLRGNDEGLGKRRKRRIGEAAGFRRHRMLRRSFRVRSLPAGYGIARPFRSAKPARRVRHRQQKTARSKPRGKGQPGATGRQRPPRLFQLGDILAQNLVDARLPALAAGAEFFDHIGG